MNEKRIEIGDYVHINFNNSQYTLSQEAKVLYCPNCIGDGWIIEDYEYGRIIYVSEPCTITLIKKGTPE